MSTVFEAMSRKRKQRQKVRLTISVSQDVVDCIHMLFEEEPDKTATQIISEAVRFAHRVGMYKPARRFENDVRMETGKSLMKGVGPLEEKKEWIAMYGGEHDNINVKFMKYEVTPTGTVVRNPQVIPLKSMPSNQDEFRKMILGKFATVNQAETAFETQPNRGELAPVRMIGQKRPSK